MAAGTSPTMEDKYALEEGTVFMTGVQALVRLPLEQHRADVRAGLRTAAYISGYQGSPLGGYDLELGRQRERLEAANIVHQPAVNEELAATAIMGTQIAHAVGKLRFDGVVGYWYGKAPGLDRATDALRHANLVGAATNGGALAFVGDDGTAKSSTVPSSSEAALYDLAVPIFVPGDVQDVIDYGLHAVAMSRSCGIWAALKIATPVADGSGTVEVGRSRVDPIPATPVLDGLPYRHQPHSQLVGPPLLALERSLFEARLEGAREYGRRNGLNRTVCRHHHDTIGVIAVGRAYFDLRQALFELGLDEEQLGLRIMKVGMPFPLDEGQLREFATGLREIIVIEEKRGFVEPRVKEALYPLHERPVVVGKRDEEGRTLFPTIGDFDAALIARVMGSRIGGVTDVPEARQRLEALSSVPEPAPLAVARTPYFCSGCPHSSSVKVPEESVVGGGIGCHAIVLLMDDSQTGKVTGLTQMGGEGAQWIGIAPFVDAPHFYQNIGDGTFMHSGSLAVRAAIAAGVDVTFKLLFNSAVAMTGGQQPAGGGLSVPEMCALLLAEGVEQIIVTTEDLARYTSQPLPAGVEVWDRSRLIEAQERLAGVKGATVLIHDQECATEKRRKRKRGKLEEPAKRIFINERVCEGCGDCGTKSNCLSVVPFETEFGRKTRIHQASCNKDYSCVEGECPSFIEVIPGDRRAASPALAPLGSDASAPPDLGAATGDYTIRITGVGGTGIVTLAQVLAVAAQHDGWRVRGLDQIGLAQKGGPVVSDLRLSTGDRDGSNRLASADCDLYLGCDLLVAAEGRNLTAALPSRTRAVVSTTEVATGHMVADVKVAFPRAGALTDRIAGRVRESTFLSAQEEASRLFGSDPAANVLLLGVAYQLGAVPINAASIENAIRLNGTAVEMNLQAFRRGRQRVSDPAAYTATVRALTPVGDAVRPLSPPARALIERVGARPESRLAALLAVRVPDLEAYQDIEYARRFVDDVVYVHAAERRCVPESTALAEAVAFQLHKLMAYKDEAEVARLHLDPGFRRRIEAEFGAGARFAWKLHPPLLRALGLRRKITLGEWFVPAYRVLYAMRRLRGTRLDPFGYATVRRVERELIVEYRNLIRELSWSLTADNHALAVEIAQLPDMVRGYEHVKLANVARYRDRVAELTRESRR